MSYIQRHLSLSPWTESKSAFLFGPRQTGKTSLIQHSLSPEIRSFNLLDHKVFLSLSTDPTLLRQLIESDQKTGKNSKNSKLVVVDEIQKLPVLLDEIHLLIEKYQIRFLMTGSSARKLRRGGVNLLGGRARELHLHPLTYGELGEQFDLIKALNRGLLPSIYFSDNPRADLRSYAGSYLDQEIAVEAQVRNITAFARFLAVAATCNGQIINQTAIASDAKVPRKTIAEYFEILKDTLIAYEVPAFTRSKLRKPLETSKLYFFDGGIARAIRDATVVKEKSADFGEAFEHFIFHELKTFIDYRRPGTSLSYWRSTSGFEVDFILGDETAIEIKAKRDVSARDLRGIKALSEEKNLRKYVVVCLEDEERIVAGNIRVMPWRKFLDALWRGEMLSVPDEI